VNLDDLRDSKDAAWTVTKVAALLDLDERTIRRACSDGQLPSIRLGVRILIPTEYLRQRFCPDTPDTDADPSTNGSGVDNKPAERAHDNGTTSTLRTA